MTEITFEQIKELAGRVTCPIISKETYKNSSYYPAEDNFYSEEINLGGYSNRIFTGFMPMRGSRHAMNGGKNGYGHSYGTIGARPLYLHPLAIFKRYMRRYGNVLNKENQTIKLSVKSPYYTDFNSSDFGYFTIRRISEKFGLYSPSSKKIEDYYHYNILEDDDDYLMKNVVCIAGDDIFLTNDADKIDCFNNLNREVIT